MALAAENEILKRDLSKCELDQVALQGDMKDAQEENLILRRMKTTVFSIDSLLDDESTLKYYTAFNKSSFEGIGEFLLPQSQSCTLFTYNTKGNPSKLSSLSMRDQLLLTICKLRHNLDFQDLGYRYGITFQTASVIFNTWVNYMFLRFGEISFWPPRDVLFQQMPEDYAKEFPNTFVIVDCTELKIQKPSSLKAQSQTYSDYKSSNTLKALVAVDPRGSVIFSSMLFSGSMSDKEIFKKSKFKATLQNMVEIGYLKEGDGIMADKGFDIEPEVTDCKLVLNIPPFARQGFQMNEDDAMFQKKIAKHRVHVERAIRRIKTFKIISGRIPVSLMSSIDQIWFVCSFLTNFMPPCIRWDDQVVDQD